MSKKSKWKRYVSKPVSPTVRPEDIERLREEVVPWPICPHVGVWLGEPLPGGDLTANDWG